MPLAALAGRQHGVVSIRQLLGPLGYSRSAVARATSAGRLHRLHRGVYAVGHTRLSAEGRCLAGVLACQPQALLSHRSAAWLWGLLRWEPRYLEITAPNTRRSVPSMISHRSHALIAEDRTAREGIPVTSVPRTILDAGVASSFHFLQRMIEHAEELRLFDLAQFEGLLARTNGHRGTGRLRRAIALYRPPAFTRSELERRFLALVGKAGLPPPVTGHNEAGYELDVYWPRERFAVELDTFETHGTRQAFERDRHRAEDLMLIDVAMLRVTDRRLESEEREVIEHVARLLERRRRQRR